VGTGSVFKRFAGTTGSYRIINLQNQFRPEAIKFGLLQGKTVVRILTICFQDFAAACLFLALKEEEISTQDLDQSQEHKRAIANSKRK
jgi:hypothetical protein